MGNNKRINVVDWLQSIELERDLTLADWNKAKAMHKEEIKEALIDGAINERVIEYRIPHYYNETFGGNK